MGMERVVEGASAITHKVIQVTPAQLRQLALRLEVAARDSALPGEWITCPLTRTIMLAYDPGVSDQKWRNTAGTQTVGTDATDQADTTALAILDDAATPVPIQ